MEQSSGVAWKWIIGIIVILAIVWFGYSLSRTYDCTDGCGTGGMLAAQKTIKIGVVMPLTGPAAAFGVAGQKMIEMAQAELSGTKNQYQVVIEDDGSNPANAASVAQKLTSLENVRAILTTTSPSGNAIKPIAVVAGIPLICVGCADQKVPDGKLSYNYSVLPDKEAAGWLTEAQKRQIKTVAFLSQNHAGINALADAIERNGSAFGITFVYKDRYDAASRDFKTQIIQAKGTKPDTYLLIGFPPGIDVIGQQLKDFGITNISGATTFGIAAKPELFEGLWMTDFPLADDSIRTRFVEKFPEIRFNYRSGPTAYDAFNLLVKGFEAGGDIGNFLQNSSSYDGVAGTATKTPGGGVFELTTRVYTMQNGRQTLAQ